MNNFAPKFGAILLTLSILYFPTMTLSQSCTAGSIATDQTVCSGGDPEAFTQVTAATGVGTLTYEWQSSPTGCSNFTAISGTNSTTYDPPSGLSTTTYYRRVVTDSDNTPCTAATTCIIVTVALQPVVSNQPNQTQCNTGTFTMTQSSPSVGTGVWTVTS